MDDEQEAIEYLKRMPKGQLMLVQHKKYKMQCCVLGCNRYWNVFDFGIAPLYYVRSKFYNLQGVNYCCDYHFKTHREYGLRAGDALSRLIQL